ncbi:hypothetical protein IscW_ISCW019695, partial [Ixodes scapularis]
PPPKSERKIEKKKNRNKSGARHNNRASRDISSPSPAGDQRTHEHRRTHNSQRTKTQQRRRQQQQGAHISEECLRALEREREG